MRKDGRVEVFMWHEISKEVARSRKIQRVEEWKKRERDFYEINILKMLS